MRKNNYTYEKEWPHLFKIKWIQSLRGYMSFHFLRLQAVCEEPELTLLRSKALYSSCNLDNSVAAETVWPI